MTALALAYDPVLHRTTAPDGRDVPHVTAVLAAVGVTADFDELARTAPRVAEAIRHAGLRGTAVHADCHAYDDGDLDWATVHPAVRPYVEAWAECRAALGLDPVARERRLFDPHNWYTGIMDGVFARKGKRVLVDIKTGDPEDAAAHLQTAAYEGAWLLERPDQPIAARWAIQLLPGRRVPYRHIDYTARPGGHQDYAKWLACLCTFNEQPSRRVRAR